MIRSTFLTSAAVVLVASVANAAPVTIDNFDNTQYQVVGAPTLSTTNPQNPATTSGPTTDAIGGTRTITNKRTLPTGTGNAFTRQVQTTVADGEAFIALGSNTEGYSVFQWNAGGADLTDGGLNDRIEITVTSFDLGPVNFELNFGGTLDLNNDMLSGGVSFSQSTTSTGVLTFGFSDFGGVDFSSVGAISLMVTGPASFDTSIDIIEATGVVPLPAAGLLALGGIGALGALRARRK